MLAMTSRARYTTTSHRSLCVSGRSTRDLRATRKMSTKPSKTIETFSNPAPHREYQVRFDCPEFTCVCPMTGQPDFATLRIDYVPDALCVELKSLKLFLWSFRDEGHFHEAVTNLILDELVAAVKPRRMRVVGDFKVRGGIRTEVEANYESAEAVAEESARR